ncbi:hypothetical protein [Pseudomonas sp. PWP3-1b2]|uniref:hypothetical protein n=1 Tax=Pseudomonas sp. PWP3-1b2 TaxID=2804656 RepID=UPI003CED7C59
MKTKCSQRMLLIIGLSALLSGPALAAFGDNPNPSAQSLTGAGSALPPGNYPSSPADSDKKTATPPRDDKATSSGSSTKQPRPKKQKKAPPQKD